MDFQGNEKFKRKDNAGALKLYTESIICAPEYGPELSLAYGNRSAALFHCAEYRAALDDVQMALKSKYPKNIEYKILQRKAQCLLRLGSYAEAVEVGFFIYYRFKIKKGRKTEHKKGPDFLYLSIQLSCRC